MSIRTSAAGLTAAAALLVSAAPAGAVSPEQTATGVHAAETITFECAAVTPGGLRTEITSCYLRRVGTTSAYHSALVVGPVPGSAAATAGVLLRAPNVPFEVCVSSQAAYVFGAIGSAFTQCFPVGIASS